MTTLSTKTSNSIVDMNNTTTTVYNSIANFYTDKTIFITGVTGFLGKVLLEKLLYSCPNVKRIYVLLRPKRGQSVQTRLVEMCSSRLFDRIRTKHSSGLLEKIVSIKGDLLEPNLGISEADRQMLCEEVQIIFHSAATVRFDEPLKLAVSMNIEGTLKMLTMAKDMQQLLGFVHVSTAYANCTENEIDELIYPPPIHPQKLLDTLSWMDESMIDKISKEMIGKHPNTYTYTKQLSEHLVNEFTSRENIPIAILRPSIIVGSLAEPQPGWVDNFNGPSGIITALGKGLLRTMLGDTSKTADIIPVDLVSNMLIAVGWRLSKNTLIELTMRNAPQTSNALTSTLQLNDGENNDCGDIDSQEKSVTDIVSSNATRPHHLDIYNCTCGAFNRVTWRIFETTLLKYFDKYPVQDCVRPPKAKFTKHPMLHEIKCMLSNRLFAVMMDMWLYISGRKAIFVRINRRVERNIKCLQYFTHNEWVFATDNVRKLWQEMSIEDRQEFNFDCTRIKWNDFITNYCHGIRHYALQEDPSKIEEARAHVKKLQRISFIVNCTLAIIIWRLLINRVPIAHRLWSLVLSFAMRFYRTLPHVAKAS